MAFPAAPTVGDKHTEGDKNFEYVTPGVWIFDSFTAASEITNVAAGNLAATNVQDALNELQGDIDALGNIVGNYVGSNATLAGLNALTDPIGGGTPDNGDWAVLSADDGANVRGIYVADGAGNFTLALPISFASATATEEGLVELATNAEAIAGTDATRAVTPANLPGAVAAHETVTSISGVNGSLFTFNDEDGTANPVDLRIPTGAALPADGTAERAFALIGHGTLPDSLYFHTGSVWVQA